MNPQVFFDINNTLCRFFLAFDQRNWALMEECLAPEILIDYESSGRDPLEQVTAQEFIRRRASAIDDLAKQHSFSNLYISEKDTQDSVIASCNYLILRFSKKHVQNDNSFYHSCGQYEFTFASNGKHWLIAAIKQLQIRSWGDKSLHGKPADK